MKDPKLIVVSAVNIRKGGTLTILKDCLKFMSANLAGEYRIVAIVHDKNLCDFPSIEYISYPEVAKSWSRRIKFEYVDLLKISKEIGPVYLWLSLHDTTPRVHAQHRAVYCQTSFPFMKWKFRDFRMDWKIPLFSMLTRFVYRCNVHKNDFLIVQQHWFKRGLSKILGVDNEKFLVFPPRHIASFDLELQEDHVPLFLFVSTPDCHKNFEVLLSAAEILEKRIGNDRFKVRISIAGNENRYASWLYRKWASVNSVEFAGFLNREMLAKSYSNANCLVFPSRVETWGLPITEFMATEKPMILADLPYAHETASGAEKVAFFDPEDPEELAAIIERFIAGDYSNFAKVPDLESEGVVCQGWNQLFGLLLHP